jgi:hypothetical protein
MRLAPRLSAMKRIPLLLALLALGSTTAKAADAVQVAGALPAQGLLVASARDTAVIGLDGKLHSRIANARAPWRAATNTARNAAFQQLANVVPDRTLLAGPHGTWYELDSSGRLLPLTSPQVRLFGDVEVVARPVPTDDGVFDVKVSVERRGETIVPAAAELRRISGHLAVGASLAVDLRSGSRWKLSTDCYAAGLVRGALLEFCGESGQARTLVSISPTGTRRTISQLPKSLYASSAYVSPNGRYVIGMFTPGCGPSYGFVVSTSGGDARPLSGEKRWSLQGPNSIGLGWTRDNRVVAILQRSSKLDHDPKRGVYLIDPQTLTRTLVYPSAKAWAMWNPA